MRSGLATNPTSAARTFWLSTRDGNGRPHMTAVGAYWVDGRYYFCGGPRSRKIRNIERDPRCALGVAIEGYDVALEGRAERVTDEGHLERLAQCSPTAGGRPRTLRVASPTGAARRVPVLRRGPCTSSPPTTCTR